MLHSSETGISLRTFLWIDKRYGLMKFTQVIFNTYSFFLEFIAKAISTQSFFTCKNSLSYYHFVSVKTNGEKFFSTNAPLKNHLFIKLASRFLNDKSVRYFYSLSTYSLKSSLFLTNENESRTQGKYSL